MQQESDNSNISTFLLSYFLVTLLVTEIYLRILGTFGKGVRFTEKYVRAVVSAYITSGLLQDTRTLRFG